jgi:hypothetical protein
LAGAARQESEHIDAALDVAGLSYLADFGERPDRPCWRCDPVYLQSDLSRVYLFDAVQRELDREAAGQLTRAFNGHFADDGLELTFADPQRWYLFGLDRVEPPPHALTTLIGRDIQALLPRDARLGLLLTEVQRLLHSLALNTRRESEGRMPVNGVWIHGRGRWPGRDAVPWTAIYSEAVSDHGLAQYAGVPVSVPPDDLETLDTGTGFTGMTLIRSDRLLRAGIEGHAQWLAALEHLENQWLRPLWRSLRAGRFGELIIDDGEGLQFRISRRRARSWWRRLAARRRPLRDWVKEAGS